MRVVIKLGHALGAGFPEAEGVMRQCEILKQLAQLGNEVVVVVGGGKLSRDYISLARRLGASWAECDKVGIDFTRMNARLFVAALGDAAYPEVARDLGDLAKFFQSGKIVVMGGISPGQSTDAAGALAAEAVKADLFLRTLDVEGVYDADPKRDRNARKLDAIRIEDLKRLSSLGGEEAGQYELLDHVAVNILARSKIPTVFLDGREPENILKAARGERVGTRVLY
ncbi:MAG: UMP kinase [Candidatus Brockarchaeota archaeon]|nr:UMP kinase [Candidatus Brockarchaeota archaeon]